MGIWQKIVQSFSGQQYKLNDKKVPATLMRSGSLDLGLNHRNGLEHNELIFSVITRLANTISSMPVRLYHNYKEVTDGVGNLVNGSANPTFSSFDLLNKTEVSRDETGNGIILIERDVRMQPVALWPIPPRYVTPFIDRENREIWYEITGINQNMMVNSSDVIHVKHITGASRIWGISPLKVLHGALDFDNAVQEFSINEMSKKDSFKVKYDANVDDELRENVIDGFRNFIAENGGVLFQEPGVEIDEIQHSFNSGNVSDTDKITRTRIANAYNIPVSFLNDLSGGYSSNEQNMTQFVQMTVVPIVKQYESEFNRKLLTPQQRAQGYYFKFNVNGLMRGDTQARTAFYQMMIRNGIASSNDLRKLEDMPPIDDENANKLWISGDLYPIDMDPVQRKGVMNNDKDSKSTKVPDDSATDDK